MVIGIIILVLFFGYGFFTIGRNILTNFDRTKWKEDAKPAFDAVVTFTDVEQVKYVKNDAKFKTTVYFSDGFIFITFRTNRKQHLLSYDISVDKAEILEYAESAHAKAVEKKMKSAAGK